MKTVHVVAAVIEEEGRILAMQRGYGDYKGQWEFPGGKVEPGETEEEALAREIHEELNADIAILRHLCTVDYDYDDFHLHMSCFICRLESDRFELIEHSDARWLDPSALDSLDWLPSDISVLRKIEEDAA